MATKRYVIWSLQNITLDKVGKELAKDNFDSPIEYTSEEGMSEEYFKNHWINEEGGKTFKKHQVVLPDESGTSINYIYAKALFETGYGRKRAMPNGELLPREARVFNHEVDACFFEQGTDVYVILEIMSSQEVPMRNKMFSFINNEGQEIPKPKFKDLASYKLSSNFYYWMLHKSSNKIEDDISHITFYNISSVSQIDNKKSYGADNVGNNVLGFTNVLSGLGEEQQISKVQIGVNFKSSNLILVMNEECQFEVDMDSLKLKNRLADSEFTSISLFLYSVLVPELFKLYHKERESNLWNDDVLEATKKHWSLSAISNLLFANDIEVEEIIQYVKENDYIQ